MKKVIISQIKSKIGVSPAQRDTLRSLGLRKIGSKVEKDLSPQIQGMIQKVNHLISIEEAWYRWSYAAITWYKKKK